MSDNQLEEAFTKVLLNDSTNKLQKIVEERMSEFEQELTQKIDNVQDKLSSRVQNLDNIQKGKPLVVNLGTVSKPKNQLVHKSFNTIIKVLQSAKRINKNIMLVGPSGSSKSTLASQVADALHLQFYPMSVGLQTTKSDLLGYLNVKGEYVPTPIRQAFENGGVLLLDEFDATHAGVVTILNSLLANDICSFPDKIITKHKDFVCMVACNTYGKGGSVEYVGRNRLDSATLDRFICIDVDYDEKLEKQLTQNDTWFKIIKGIRKNIYKQGLKVIVSPRASMQGADLLDNGFSVPEVLDMVIFKGVTKDVRDKLIKDIDFGNANRQTNQHKPQNKKVARVEINFDTCVYSVTDLEEEISITAGVDWEGSFAINLSTAGMWQACLDGVNKMLCLNFGENRTLIGTPKDTLVKDFIADLNHYSENIVTPQPLEFHIVYKNVGYTIKAGDF